MHSIFLPHPSSSSSFSPSSSVSISTPRVNWPLWTRALAKFRRPADRGLGDTLVHLLGDTRSERFKKWFTRKFGKTCGCTERQRWLNRKFPYAD